MADIAATNANPAAGAVLVVGAHTPTGAAAASALAEDCPVIAVVPPGVAVELDRRVEVVSAVLSDGAAVAAAVADRTAALGGISHLLVAMPGDPLAGGVTDDALAELSGFMTSQIILLADLQDLLAPYGDRSVALTASASLGAFPEVEDWFRAGLAHLDQRFEPTGIRTCLVVPTTCPAAARTWIRDIVDGDATSVIVGPDLSLAEVDAPAEDVPWPALEAVPAAIEVAEEAWGGLDDLLAAEVDLDRPDEDEVEAVLAPEDVHAARVAAERHLETLEAAITAAHAALARATTERETADHEAGKVGEASAAMRAAAAADVERMQAVAADAATRAEEARAAARAAHADASGARLAVATAGDELARLSEEIEHSGERLQGLVEDTARQRRHLDDAAAAVVEAQAARAVADDDLRHARDELRRAQGVATVAEARALRADTEARSAAERAGRLAVQIEVLREELTAAHARLEEARTEGDALADVLRRVRRDIEVATARRGQEENDLLVAQAELDRARAEADSTRAQADAAAAARLAAAAEHAARVAADAEDRATELRAAAQADAELLRRSAESAAQAARREARDAADALVADAERSAAAHAAAVAAEATALLASAEAAMADALERASLLRDRIVGEAADEAAARLDEVEAEAARIRREALQRAAASCKRVGEDVESTMAAAHAALSEAERLAASLGDRHASLEVEALRSRADAILPAVAVLAAAAPPAPARRSRWSLLARRS